MKKNRGGIGGEKKRADDCCVGSGLEREFSEHLKCCLW